MVTFSHDQSPINEFPEAALTNLYKCSGLKQQVLEVMTNECPCGHFPSGCFRGNLFSYLFQFLEATSVPWLAAPSSPYYNLLLLSLPPPVLILILLLPSYRTLPNTVGQQSPSLKILNLVTSAKTLSPNKVSFTRCLGVRTRRIFWGVTIQFTTPCSTRSPL